MLTVELPNGRSTCNLGVMCEHGMCMDKTILEARELYEEVRRARVALAACNLGVMYKLGAGVEKNATKARELYEEARRAREWLKQRARDSRRLWTTRGHTQARHRCPQLPPLSCPFTTPSFTFFSFSLSSSTSPLFQLRHL